MCVSPSVTLSCCCVSALPCVVACEGHVTEKSSEKLVRSVEMDKVLSKDSWSVPVRGISLDNTYLCLCVLINVLNIPALLDGLLIVELSCSKAASSSLGSSTLHAKFTLVG